MIQVQDVRKSFGEEEILHGVSRRFTRGQIHGIIGNNGSGKTVLMKCICGFLRPTSGKIIVDGKEVGRDMDFPEHMGIIIETPGFLPNLTGIKNLRLLASLRRKISESEIREAIKRVGLNPDMKKPVSKYSLGMRQRLGIAQAIMEDPELLILDEPFNGLDKNGVAHMRELIKGLRGEGKTILLASHNQGDIDELCDTVCEMDAGVMTMIRGEEETTMYTPQRKLYALPSPALVEELTLMENAALPLLAQGMKKRKAKIRAAELLQEMGLSRAALHAHPSMVAQRQIEIVLEAQERLEGERKT